MDKYLTIFKALGKDIDLEDKEIVISSKDPELAKWYSAIGLLGMSAKELGNGVSTGKELGEKLNTALQDRYRDNDELKKEVEDALEILKKTISDTTLIFNKYTVNYEIAIRALTDSNEAKDKIIEDRDETIRRLRKERVEKLISTDEKVSEDALQEPKDSSENTLQETDPTPRSHRRLSDLKDLLKRDKGESDAPEDPVREEQAQKDPEDTSKDTSKIPPDGEGENREGEDPKELGNFIDEYINNEEYSEEARSYLLGCYQSGTPLEVIRQFARPQFSVKIMKKLKRIYERKHGNEV